MESVAPFATIDTHHPDYIAVGHEVETFYFPRPMIIVFRHYEHFVTAQLLLAVQHLGAYGTVVVRGPAVAARYEQAFLYAVAGISRFKHFGQILSRHYADIGEPGCAQRRNLGSPRRHGAPQRCGIVEYPRTDTLTHGSCHHGTRRPQTEHTEPFRLHGRRFDGAYGRQLRRVAYKNHTAVVAAVHVLHEVFKKAVAARTTLAAYH